MLNRWIDPSEIAFRFALKKRSGRLVIGQRQATRDQKEMKRQPHLRLVITEPRKNAQSTSGHSDSQRTLPLDSRSIAIASDSAQERDPYTTFLKCPKEMPQREAKADRSATVIPFQKVRRSMMTQYHHAVIKKATPNGEFTGWCAPSENEGMENHTAGVRRRNLARLINRDFDGNKSGIARAYDPENPKPQYFSDLIRPDSGKSFGEKAARKIEERTGLLPGQLDIPDSPLLLDESRRSRVKDEIRLALDDLDKDEQREALAAIRKIQLRRNARRKAS